VEYTIEVKNPQGVSKGVKSLIVDGKKVAGNLLPSPSDGRTAVKVEVTLGA
jgi:cellobiose phosphorylase